MHPHTKFWIPTSNAPYRIILEMRSKVKVTVAKNVTLLTICLIIVADVHACNPVPGRNGGICHEHTVTSA